MSTIEIKRAFEIALSEITPALPTAWDNVEFNPVAGQSWQKVDILFAEPDNPEWGSGYQQRGFMQVMLFASLLDGAFIARQRAELLRSIFYRKATFTNGGIVVQVERTPDILPGRVDNDWYTLPVRVRFFANIFN